MATAAPRRLQKLLLAFTSRLSYHGLPQVFDHALQTTMPSCVSLLPQPVPLRLSFPLVDA